MPGKFRRKSVCPIANRETELNIRRFARGRFVWPVCVFMPVDKQETRHPAGRLNRCLPAQKDRAITAHQYWEALLGK
jgi:hypothetical protein